jgi:hypothetical protein
MAGIRVCLVLAAGVAFGGALVIAHRVSQETGKSLVESFGDVPAEAQRIAEDVRFRAEEALDRARQAYERKQADMEAYMNQGGEASG